MKTNIKKYIQFNMKYYYLFYVKKQTLCAVEKLVDEERAT